MSMKDFMLAILDFDLTNHCEGGKGSNGFKHTEESKRKIMQNKLGTIMPRDGVERSRKAKFKPIMQFSKENKLVKEWDSILQTSEEGFYIKSVSKCCLGKLKTHKGYIWRFKNEAL